MIMFTVTLIAIHTGCKKEDNTVNDSNTTADNSAERHGQLTHRYSADVANAWMKMQLQIMKTATGIPNVAFSRPFAYSAITLYESVLPGMPSYITLSGQLNAMPSMPGTICNLEYRWDCSANAAMASILKKMYPTTSAANVFSIDSLETVLNTQCSTGQDPVAVTRSVTFGRDVAQLVYNWALTDGSQNINPVYIAPTGSGLWESTPPAFASASVPYWGANRLMVSGSGSGALPPPPTPYSTTPGSPFYNMVKQVYDASQTLTIAQTNQALYWKDVPGVTTPGHYISIAEQAVEQRNSALDKAAVVYALAGIVDYDACIICWQHKYLYNLVRPITYIRNVMGYTTWNSLLTTPAHPEYSSGHAFLSAANARALESAYGNHFAFTDHTYDYLGMPSRSFTSFKACGEDAGNSRLYAGIHYQPTIDLGLVNGRTVAQNIINTIHFK